MTDTPKDKMTMNTEEKFVRVIATLIEVLKRQVKREDREQAIEKLNQAERLFLRYFLSSVITPDEIDRCPICAAAFKADDVCASDITEGTCHAACLEGSPVVDLETGKETGGKVDTYRYSEVMEPAPKDKMTGNLAYNIGVEIRYAIAAAGADPIQHIPEVDAILARRVAEIRREAFEEAAKIADEHAADFENKAPTASSDRGHVALLLASDACELIADAIRAIINDADRGTER